ncbi:DUF3460 family protein [Orrella sp. 11846]|uniref:DUF3460 family protein n=1 Tax=Orrella sp. 11846 TaxID=3409913 RepID=UPI003B5B505E
MAAHYESEATRFIRAYKEKHPDAEQRQLEGRARLWDKTLNPEDQEAFKQARVPQTAYVYQND